ncbi:MAG: HAMP domain-containing sensor histidine kinase [Elusimicrobiales bacterium]|nr:HAMP domain-containing sensor histidine kinase [Elusimicrobiales bacterium]
MHRLSGYNARFLAIEIFSYFLLLVPWLGDFFGAELLRYGAPDLILKIGMSAAIIVFIFLLRDVRRKSRSLELLKKNLSLAAIHDLKGPLTSMIGALQLIEDNNIDLKMRDSLLSVASRSTRDMQKLIQVLLDTERMEISELALERIEVPPLQLIREAVKPLLPVAEETGVSVSLPGDKDLPVLLADRDLIVRVFENLMLNALKYSRRGGKVAVSADFSDGVLRFGVSDNGAGIAPEHVKKVFEKYFRVEGQEAQSRKGSGIGLYFCRLAVEAHGGKIVIDSAPGRGTTVTFDLPVRGPAR